MSSLAQSYVRRPISLLTINGGSSSIKLAVFQKGESLCPTWRGGIDRIGLGEVTLKFEN